MQLHKSLRYFSCLLFWGPPAATTTSWIETLKSWLAECLALGQSFQLGHKSFQNTFVQTSVGHSLIYVASCFSFHKKKRKNRFDEKQTLGMCSERCTPLHILAPVTHTHIARAPTTLDSDVQLSRQKATVMTQCLFLSMLKLSGVTSGMFSLCFMALLSFWRYLKVQDASK